MNLKSNLKRK